MSLFSTLYNGTSGLQSSSLDLAVIGDNIANANTIGFKGSRAAFEEEMAQSLIGDLGQTGMGVETQAVRSIVTQGSLSQTGQATDLALQGNGYFMVKGAHDGTNGTYYTRAGQFTVDKSGYLVNLDGLRVQGYGADATGAIGPSLGDLAIGTAASAPKATANVQVKGNLAANATVPAAWDPANPNTTSNFSTSSTVYDTLGNSHQVQVYFRKSAAGAWEYHAMTDGGGVQGGTAGTPSEIAAGTLSFDTSGKLTAQTQTGTFNPVGATQPQTLTFNFGDPTSTPGGTGLAGFTQFANPSAVSFTNQDGYTSGDLASVKVDTQGNVIGAFTNGQTRDLGQVAVANFTSPDQLQRTGGTLYAATPKSGQPAIGAAGTGGRASVVAGALEQSNVDLAGEFVKMIGAQRNFEANSKTVMTADQLLNELIQIKR